MQWQIIHSAWPALLPLAYVLIVCVLSILCRAHRHEQDLHNVVREAVRQREDFVSTGHAGDEAMTPEAAERARHRRKAAEADADRLEADERERRRRLTAAATAQKQRLRAKR